jgi:hypothetical protein
MSILSGRIFRPRETGRMAQEVHVRPVNGTIEEGHDPTGPDARSVASGSEAGRPGA